MASLNDAFYIARSGMLTHQERLAVISHNIANVDTKGYHRQLAVLGTNPENAPNLYSTRNYTLGTGVRVMDVIRLRDEMREKMLIDQSSEQSKYEQMATSLGDLEAMMNGLGDTSLSSRLQEFWSSWQDLANNADRLAYRSTLLESSVTLTDQFNQLATNLSDYREAIASGGTGPDFTGAVARGVDEVNQLATRLQDLNSRITTMTSQGQSPNDMQDQRDLLVRELGDLTNISVSEDYTISIDGQLLVSGNGTTRNELSITNTDSIPMEFALDGATVNITQGSLGGLVEVASYLDSMSTNLDTLANELISAVNSIHLSGYDLDGNPGVEFFTGTGAAGITVNSLLHNPDNPQLDNPSLIAAANTLHDPGPPPVANVQDGANALEIADLCRAQIAGLGNQTFGDYFSNIVSDLGIQVENASNNASDSDMVVQMLEADIQSVNGVNLDEELMEMIAAQRAYQASAKAITTIDEMMELVITGLVR